MGSQGPAVQLAALLLALWAAVPSAAALQGNSTASSVAGYFTEASTQQGTVEDSPVVFDVPLLRNESLLLVTATPAADSKSYLSLYCRLVANLGNVDIPSSTDADYFGEQLVGAPTVIIASADVAFGNATEVDVRCAVVNSGPSSAPVDFTFSVQYATSAPVLVASEQAAAEEIFAACCEDKPERCMAWEENAAANITNLCALSMNLCTADGQLVELSMRGYQLQCALPVDALLNFTQLQLLNLALNPAVTGDFGSVADSLADLDQLAEVSLRGMQGLSGPLSPDGEDGVCNLARRAAAIDLAGIGLTGSVPECLFGDIPEPPPLKDFRASGNNLSGSLPDMAVGIGDSLLQVLLLAENSLTGPLPASWLSLSNLAMFDLSSNRLTGPLLPSLEQDGFVAGQQLPPGLVRLLAPFNALTGAFPSPAWLDRAPALESLDLSHNNLTEMPSGFLTTATPPPLVSLAAASNQMRGSFPAFLGSLPTLVQLDISSNRLNGTLPSLDGEASFASVMLLSAGTNSFSGSIPESWASVGAVSPNATTANATTALLDLSNNALTGALPDFLAYRNVKQLRPVPDVNLSGNAFTSLTCQEYEYADAACNDTRPPVPAPVPSPPPPVLLPPPPSSVPGDTQSDDGGSGGLSSGAAAGIAIAVILVAACGVAAIFYLRKRRHLARGANPLSTNRFERFEDNDVRGSWGQQGPAAPQQSGWDAYQQPAGAQGGVGGVQLSSQRPYEP